MIGLGVRRPAGFAPATSAHLAALCLLSYGPIAAINWQPPRPARNLAQ